MNRKGFTLVELLIVISVIAALAVMMMMANAGAVAEAEVSAIMGNLRSLKTAALSEYFRSKDYYDTIDTASPHVDLILAQLGTRSMKGYTVSADEKDDSIWYAVYNGKSTKEVADKIFQKTETMGLLKMASSSGNSIKAVSSDYKEEDVTANAVIGIRIK